MATWATLTDAMEARKAAMAARGGFKVGDRVSVYIMGEKRGTVTWVGPKRLEVAFYYRHQEKRAAKERRPLESYRPATRKMYHRQATLVEGVEVRVGRSMDRLAAAISAGLPAAPAMERDGLAGQLAAGLPLETPVLDKLTRTLTAFSSFSEMLDTPPNYRPSIITDDLPHRQLAQAYDVAQAARGDARRAFTGSGR